MLSNTLTALVLSFSLVAAGPIVKRSVLTDLTTIGNDLATLQKDITGWDGSLPSAIPLLGDVTNVENAIKTAINDTDASAPFDASDSTSVTNEVVSLEPQISTTLNDLVQKVSLSALDQMRALFSILTNTGIPSRSHRLHPPGRV